MTSPKRLSQPSYWQRRAKAGDRRAFRARAWSRLSASYDNYREDRRVAGRLLTEAIPSILSAVVIIAGVLLAASVLSATDFPLFVWLGASDDGPSQDLLAAGVGAVAALLGLYYATVGVVASTVYQNVPPAVRTLFLEERSGLVYVGGLVRTLVIGVVALSMLSTGFQLPRLLICVFALQAASAVFRLSVLGNRIFNFFDPTTLARALASRFLKQVRAVSQVRQVGIDREQAARGAGQRVLTTYSELAILVEDSKNRSAAGSVRLSSQLIALSTTYAYAKRTISRASGWWPKVQKHRDWMTQRSHLLGASVLTGSNMPPETRDDRVWVESAMADLIGRTLRASLVAGGPESVMRFSAEFQNLVAVNVRALQIEEALTYMRAWEITMSAVIERESAPGSLVGLSASEHLVAQLTWSWQDLVETAVDLSKVNPTNVYEQAQSRGVHYSGNPLPYEAREVAERFILATLEERKAEGREVSAAWWRNHYLARAVSNELSSAFDSILNEIARHIERLEVSDAPTTNRAIVALSLLAWLDRATARHDAVERSWADLAKHRNTATGNASWPDAPSIDLLPDYRRRVLRALTECLPSLRGGHHDASSPDLYGQSYQVLTEAAFSAILDGAHEDTSLLFAAVLAESDFMKKRVLTDLADFDMRTRVAYAAEPIVALLDLSGSARVLDELDGKSAWSEIRILWEEALSRSGQPGAEVLLAAYEMSNAPTFVGSSDLLRSSRQGRLEDKLKAAGVPERGELGDERSAGSPILNAYAPGRYQFYKPADLFVADFLTGYLPTDVVLPQPAAQLMRALHRRKEGQ